MRAFFEDRRLIYLLVLCVFAGGCGVTAYLYRLDQQQQKAHFRDHVLEEASNLRVGIEHQVNTSLNLTMGLVIYVATHPDITQQEFEAIAARVLEHSHDIQNIGLAKDNVISHIYPLSGNEKAIGLRYMDMPQQRDAVVRAIQARGSIIAGPVDLVQGGSGFISRIPIFLDKEHSRYWGLASVVINVDDFFREAGIDRFAPDLDLALRGKDSLGESGAVFYGDAALFQRADATQLPITLPNGSWVLAAVLRDGAHGLNRQTALLVGIGVGISLLLSLFLYLLLDLLAALSKANQRAAQASEQKTRFFSQMTHELRTPLTAIQGVVGLLASGKISLDETQTGELLQNAHRNCLRLQWIVNDILDLKKLESGVSDIAWEPVPVAELMTSSVDGVAQVAQQYGIELSIDNRSGQQAMVPGDRARLQQVMANLLSNAIKYSPAQGCVTVRVQVLPGMIRVEVVDQGEGVTEDRRATIFNEFSQDRPSDKPGIASTGLGLSISKQIIEQHHGRIGCENIPGGGCCFYFELPALGQ